LLLGEQPRDATRRTRAVLAADGDERGRDSRSRKFWSTRSTPPSSVNGFVRLVPMIVSPSM
jgi:hypothetical protein